LILGKLQAHRLEMFGAEIIGAGSLEIGMGRGLGAVDENMRLIG